MIKILTYTFLVALGLLTSCGNSSTKKSTASDSNGTKGIEQLNLSDRQDSLLSGTNTVNTMDTDSIYVHSVHFTQLDTITTSWNMTEDDVHSFFEGAIPATNSEVAKMISNNYYPYSVTGKVIIDGLDYDYVINPVGVAILFNKQSRHQFFVNYTCETILKEKSASTLRIQILSYNKRSYDYDDDLGRWCKDWWLSATDINNYFKLCKAWDESKQGAVLTLFDNYNCDISGYLEMDGKIYRYWLWCNGPFFLTPIKADIHLESQVYVCQDEAGLKYIYSIEKNPTLDV